MNKILWFFSFFLSVIIIVILYNYIDISIAEYFHSINNSPLVWVASIVTQGGEAVYYIIPSLLLYLYFRKRNAHRARLSLFILATTATSGILVDILKVIFGRFRPKMYFSEHLYGFDWFHVSSRMVSFPSGHSATALGVWLAFSMLFPKYRVIFIPIGIMIALTRVITTAHYPSDVIAGSYIGIVVTLIYYQKMFPKKTSTTITG
jgi:membrane-associated phospholipid phosphatase